MSNLVKVKVFSVLDNESSYLTTFCLPKGLLYWLQMPFEIQPASEEYQCKQEEILEGLKVAETIHNNIFVLGYCEIRKETLENQTMLKKESQTQQEKSKISND